MRARLGAAVDREDERSQPVDVMDKHVDDDDASHEAYNAGRALMESGKYLEAVEVFERSAAAFPHFKTLELLGECKLLVGDPLGAIIPLAAALGLGTNAFRSAYLLSKAFAEIGVIHDAIIYVDRAIEMNSQYKRALEFRQSLKNQLERDSVE